MTARRRTSRQIAIEALPGAIIASYWLVAVFEGPVLEGLMYSLLLGAMVQGVGSIAFIVASYCAHTLLAPGEPKTTEGKFDPPQVLAALLLCSCLYVWLMTSHKNEMERYIKCVSDWQSQLLPSVEDALQNCRHSEPEDSYDDF